MNTSLSFHPTIAGYLNSQLNIDIWDSIQELYDTGDYAKTVRECIRYIHPGIEEKYANAERTHYKIPHGSIIVEIRISDTEFEITAPFLNIGNAKRIPLLRQVAQINVTPLTLSRIELKDDQLYFHYQCPLDLCEPYKIYNIIREICINADNYDDEFISKFGANRIQEPHIEPYPTDVQETVWNTVQLYIREAFEAYDILESKRKTTYLWDILAITLLKIDYYCAPQGNLRSEIEKTFNVLNGKDDYYQRLSAAREFLKKLQSMDKQQFISNLYKIEVFVPYKFKASLESLRNGLQYAYDTSTKEIKGQDYLGALLTMQYGILNFLYSNNLEDIHADIITKAMEKTSSQPVAGAARHLYERLEYLIKSDKLQKKEQAEIAAQEKNAELPKKKKGFIRRIFGF